MDKAEREQRILDAKARHDTAYLIEALRDPDHRDLAALYLGKFGVQSAIAPLIRLLRVTDAGARTAAANALGRLAAFEAVPDLIPLVKGDPEIAVRSAAIRALGEIGDPKTIPVLLQALEDPSWFVRVTSATVLGRVGDSTAIEPLRNAAARERFFARGSYRKALRRIRARVRSGGEGR